MKSFTSIKDSLTHFLKEYLNKSGAKGFVLGLSGGIDSAVVASLAAQVAPTHALLMPSANSSQANLQDATALAKELKLSYEIINIEPLIAAFASCVNTKERLRLANITARVRMILLYDKSAQLNALVLGTSNKSERLLGYGTIYGDLACALNPIGELYKSEIYKLAKELGLPEVFITKAPSADLWQGQSDEAELGYSYEKIDSFLLKLQMGASEQELELEFGKEMSKDMLNKIKKNEFKRQMPAIANIKQE